MKENGTTVTEEHPHSETYNELKKLNPNLPMPRVFHKKDAIEEHFDRLPWYLGALGRSLTVNLGESKSLFAPINIPLDRRLQTFAALFWMSTFLFMGLGAAILLLYLFLYTQFWWFPVCYFTWYLGDRTICDRGGRRFYWFRHWVLWKHFRNYFPIHMIKTAELDPAKNYIVGYHPHGILCAGAFCSFGTEATNFSKVYPGLTPYLMTLEVQFRQPFYREFLMSSGAVSCSRQSIDYIMKKEETGQTLCIVIGGAKESLDCHPGRADLYLKNRKGFCKMALRYGASLVPTFAFGENDIYDQVPNHKGTLIRRLQTAFQSVVGFAPLIFFGRGVFQYGFGIIPFRKPIYVVVGAPVDVPLVKDPTQEDIDRVHESYVKALTELYNKYKGMYSAYPDVELKIQ
ncbi:2-acylglycerol O-acyltransferase 2-like isoform X1 [Macrobrachium rosenbergii]|uniref:2-acylglycerol O-acyltransferase 2-like isoform X1 n=1 Tax=Macrobrachium rosenbergii TaxID=79674 RepID=UPI0034D6D09A